MNKANSAYVMLHGPDMVKNAEGKDIMLHIRVVKNNDTLDLFGYKLTNVDEDADFEHWTWEFAAPALMTGGNHHAGTGYSESTKEKYKLAVEARIKSIEDNINLMKEEKMNQQIIDLAKLSGFEYDIRDGNFYVSDSAQWINKEISALVELVVLECVDALGTYESTWSYEKQMELLKKHFGVN